MWNSIISLRIDHGRLNTANSKTNPNITKQRVMANKPIKIKWNHIKYGITVKESRKTEKRKQRTDRWDK